MVRTACVVLGGVFSVLATVAPVSAGVILENHSSVYAGALQADAVTFESNGPADTGFVYEQDPDPSVGPAQLSGSARARTAISASHLLGASATGYNNTQFSDRGVGVAAAAWRDVATLVGSGPLTRPLEYIRMYFSVEAVLSVEGWANSAAVSINTATSLRSGFSFPSHAAAQLFGPGHNDGENMAFDHVGFDTLDFIRDDNVDISLVGNLHIDTPYNSTIGGYEWGVSLNVRADAFRSFTGSGSTWAGVSSLQSLSLNRVTDLEGNDVAVTFDSGLQLADTSAVPEPTSLALMGLGGIGLFGGWYRKRRSRAGTDAAA